MVGLVAEPFCEELLDEVADFECGVAPWAIEVADWIKGRGGNPPKALDLIGSVEARVEVWVYRFDGGEIVGYGSVGNHRWKRSGRWENVTYLPSIGIRSCFQGEPKGVPKEQRYSRQIISDLGVKAVKRGRPIWGLYCHQDNALAQAFYREIGFVLVEIGSKGYDKWIMDISGLLPQGGANSP